MIIQKHEVACGFYFTVRDALGNHLAVSPEYETDGLCHQAALALIDGLRDGVRILPVEIIAGTPKPSAWPAVNAGHS